MPVRYRIRLPVAIGSSATMPVLLGALIALAVRPLWAGLIVGLLFAVLYAAAIVRRVRRRSLSVDDEGLVVQRDRYRLHVLWDGVTGWQSRRRQGVNRVEELLCSGARIEAVDSRGRQVPTPQGLSGHPALTRIQVSLYAKDWRNGPIGDRLRASGIQT